MDIYDLNDLFSDIYCAERDGQKDYANRCRRELDIRHKVTDEQPGDLVSDMGCLLAIKQHERHPFANPATESTVLSVTSWGLRLDNGADCDFWVRLNKRPQKLLDSGTP